jgi:hypothetical protein
MLAELVLGRQVVTGLDFLVDDRLGQAVRYDVRLRGSGEPFANDGRSAFARLGPDVVSHAIYLPTTDYELQTTNYRLRTTDARPPELYQMFYNPLSGASRRLQRTRGFVSLLILQPVDNWLSIQ